jgi:hypothetical protein
VNKVTRLAVICMRHVLAACGISAQRERICCAVSGNQLLGDSGNKWHRCYSVLFSRRKQGSSWHWLANGRRGTEQKVSIKDMRCEGLKTLALPFFMQAGRPYSEPYVLLSRTKSKGPREHVMHEKIDMSWRQPLSSVPNRKVGATGSSSCY